MIFGKTFYEEYSYSILRALLEDIPVMIKDEYPDYSSENLGLEITRVISKSDGNYDAFLKRYMNKPYSQIPHKRLEVLGFDNDPICYQNSHYYLQQSSTFGTLCYVKTNDSDDSILSMAIGRVYDSGELLSAIEHSVNSKTNKLNNNYKIKDTNNLALLVEKTADIILLNDEKCNTNVECIKNAVSHIYDETNDLKYHFDTVYVLFWDVLIILHSNDWTTQIKYISDELRYSVMKTALSSSS